MKFYIDSANIELIKTLCDSYPIEGVTTNPTIIAKENGDYAKIINGIRKIIGEERLLFVQVGGIEGNVRIEEAERIREFAGEKLSIKVPSTENGLKVTSELKRRGFNVTQTAVFSLGQALLSASAGADYVAPYVNRFIRYNGDGIGLVKDISETFKSRGIGTQILAASFGSAGQICDVIKAGADNVTIPPELFKPLISHMMTDDAIEKFDNAWSDVYGEKQILDFI